MKSQSDIASDYVKNLKSQLARRSKVDKKAYDFELDDEEAQEEFVEQHGR